ncbi:MULTISPECIES: hypothetical protein [Streptomyces]|uniref:hypothetical protein n=1 Tax=Streptomyces TaxID=1883 RepID=UPI00131A5D1A|nr:MULTISPECIES: hypothetical protein [Streptomyces]MDP9953175.1 hypothetical protein [Streptomyces sp. DSM 41269]
MSYRLGGPIQSAIRCTKPDCGLLLINGRACGCTSRTEPERDPLVGRLVACTDPATGKVMALGKVTEVDRTGDGMTLTVAQYDNGEPAADPGALAYGMNWRDHL